MAQELPDVANRATVCEKRCCHCVPEHVRMNSLRETGTLAIALKHLPSRVEIEAARLPPIADEERRLVIMTALEVLGYPFEGHTSKVDLPLTVAFANDHRFTSFGVYPITI